MENSWDVTYSQSFVDFLKKNVRNPICNTLLSVHQNYYGNGNAYKAFITNKFVNYLTFRTDGQISYLPAGKEHKVNENGTWMRDGRQEGKAAKVIRKLFTKEGLLLFKEVDFELFSNSYKANYLETGYEFKLLPNTEIWKVYSEMKIANGECSLNGSCMRGASAETLQIYMKCPQCQILVLMKDDEVYGRCLVWTIDGKVYADRFYVVADHFYGIFKIYCKEQGWFFKKRFNSYDEKRMFIEPENDVAIEVELRIETETELKRWPYIDTFTWGGKGFITNTWRSYEETPYEYSDTSGNRMYKGNWESEDNRDHTGERAILGGGWLPESECVLLTGGYYAGHWTRVTDSIEHKGLVYRTDDFVKLRNGNFRLKSECVRRNGIWVVKKKEPTKKLVFSSQDNSRVNLELELIEFPY